MIKYSLIKFKNYIVYILILKILRGKLIHRGHDCNLFFKKLFLLLKNNTFINIPFSYLLTIAFLNIKPFLNLYKTKLFKKSKKKIEKVKHISILSGLKLVAIWIFSNIESYKTLDLLVLNFFFELCDAFYRTGRIFQKKLDHYQRCLDTRFFIK